MRAQGTAVLLPFGTVHSPSAAAALAHRSVFESVWARVGASVRTRPGPRRVVRSEVREEGGMGKAI